MKQPVAHRLACVVAALALAYAMALWSPVRAWYSEIDKLAHAVVFAAVYGSLSWALRWKPWTMVLLALVLGAVVEVHQLFLTGFSGTFDDWVADAVGIGLAYGLQLAWGRGSMRTRAVMPVVQVPTVRVGGATSTMCSGLTANETTSVARFGQER